MQQVEFDAVRAGRADIAGSLRHHVRRLPRQAQDLVDDNRHAHGLQLPHRPVKYRQVVAPADICCRLGVDGLQSQLHPHRLDTVQLPQQFQHFRPKTVRAGGNGQRHHIFRRDGRHVQLPQTLHGAVGVGEGLEIGDIAGVLPRLRCHTAAGRLHLGGNVPDLRKGAGAVAEDAAPGIQSAVPIGTGTAGGQGQLVHLRAVDGLQVVVQSIEIHIK